MFPKNKLMAKVTSRLGRGLGGLISGGGSSADRPNTKEAVPAANSKPKKAKLKSKTTTAVSTSGLSEIALEHIVPNPHQPRKTIDPETVSELAASIKSEGLLQPIVVRKSGDNFELVAGERRWHAHQKLGEKTILARVLEMTDISSASLSLIENLQREGLNPVEEALGYHSLVNDFNLTQAKVADRVGKSRVYVTNLLRLLKLHEKLRSSLAEGKLSTGHAKVLLAVEDQDAQLKLGEKAMKEGWTVRHCEREVSSFLNPNARVKPKSSKFSSPFLGMAKKAESSLGRKVKISGNSEGGGEIMFSFDDPVDLQKLLQKLEA